MVRGEIKIDVLSIGSLDAFSLTRDEGRKMEISKSNGGNILYYTETFSGGGGEGADFWNDIYENRSGH